MKTFNTFIQKGKTLLFLFAAWLCIVLATTLPCPAQQPSGQVFDPGGEEIRITSDRMIMQTDNNIVEFIGNVNALQGKTSVHSKRLKIFYRSGAASGVQEGGMSQDAIKRLEALGEVTINFKETTATSETAVYTAENGLLELSGDPARLETGENVITGKTITMNRNTGEVVAHGNKESRVEAVFTPSSKPGRNKSEKPGSGPADKEK
ncbi:MAG: hypothetical protein K9K82_06340 [Desulfobacteraceae bacterium]|nr:hypothetical protein [Desulfobacteraceae bacterium]